jgi:hypothetical protein
VFALFADMGSSSAPVKQGKARALGGPKRRRETCQVPTMHKTYLALLLQACMALDQVLVWPLLPPVPEAATAQHQERASWQAQARKQASTGHGYARRSKCAPSTDTLENVVPHAGVLLQESLRHHQRQFVEYCSWKRSYLNLYHRKTV